MSIVPAVRAFRGQVVENTHFASWVVSTKTGSTGQMFPGGDPAGIYLRSAVKPFQAYALLQFPEASELSGQEWAIVCASHAATEEQLALVRTVLARGDIPESALRCGSQAPIDKTAATTLLCEGKKPLPIHNNCSGKHAGMLLACHYAGWPMASYLDIAHPLQQQIHSMIARYSRTDQIKTAVDGCGVPVFCMPLQNAAILFRSLVENPELSTLANAMTTYPGIVGDVERIDTNLMQVSSGSLVAKVGAEGVIGVAHRDAMEGLVLKIHDGSNAARDRLVIALLEQLGWLTPGQADLLWRKPAFSRVRTNTLADPVGYYDMVLP